MKFRIVIEEVVVDAECADTQYPCETAIKVINAAAEAALRLHAARKPTQPKE